MARNTLEAEATNAAATVTIPAPSSDQCIVLREIEASYSAAPTGGLLSISDQRVDAGCVTSSTSPTVTDAAILASDAGKTVTGTGIPSNATVGNVVSGTSFQIIVSGTPTNASASGTVSLTIGAAVDEKVDITAAGPTNVPLDEEDGLRGGRGNGFTLTLAAGGAGIVGRINVSYEIGQP